MNKKEEMFFRIFVIVILLSAFVNLGSSFMFESMKNNWPTKCFPWVGLGLIIIALIFALGMFVDMRRNGFFGKK